MVVQSSRRFVYGWFHWPGKKPKSSLPPHPISILMSAASAWDQVALEIIREHSANELLGKLYIRGAGGSWVLAELSKIVGLEWYIWYQRVSAEFRARGKSFYFEMEGSGKWQVLHFRNESDETGPYIAAALRYGAG